MLFTRSISILALLASVTEITALCTSKPSSPQKRSPKEKKFIHPGILHTESDLNRMKHAVQQKLDPWYPAFLNFSHSPHSSPTYKLKGPTPFVVRNATGPQPGKAEFSNDGVAAFQNALMYYITGNESHAIKSTEILVAWSNTLQKLNGSDSQLTAGLYGPQFVNAAEIIREYYNGWNNTEIEKFKTMVSGVLYPHAAQTWPTSWQKYPFLANWGTSAEKALVAFGVFLDNSTMYYEGLGYYLHHECANVTNQINYFGQDSESGRDQGHTSLGLGNMAEISQVAWNQGDREYYGLYEDRLLVEYEYTARYNLGYDVSYDPGFIGVWSPVYEIAYGHYVQRLGKRMPWVEEHLGRQEFELTNSDNNMGDNAGYGTLRFRQLPGNLTAVGRGGV